MEGRTKSGRAALYFLSLAVLSLVGLILIYLDTYFWRSLRTVGNCRDPRWRVFDFHSRQATENEIYSVAEEPAIRKLEEVGRRRLRIFFHAPWDRCRWTVVDGQEGMILHSGRWAEIPFADSPSRKKYRLIPENISPGQDIELEIDFYPREKYREKNLSWPDNYWLVHSTVPLTPKKPFSVDEWVGFKPTDPELNKAREIIGPRIDPAAPALARSEQVFLFVMDAMRNSGGTPDDRLQAASPLETYNSLARSGRGFCENRALVYYLFANAAHVKTRLVDGAGKFGPLKLTGHYFCESFIPEEARWIYVDPQLGVARAMHRHGKLLNTLDLKKLFDLGSEKEIIYFLYDEGSQKLTPRAVERANEYLVGDLVIAYKFGYGRAKSFSKLKNFLSYPTLLYAPFPVPPLIRLKFLLIFLFGGNLVLAAICGLVDFLRR